MSTTALESPRERKLREEAVRHRRRASQLKKVAHEYAVKELQRVVHPIIAWSLFEEMIGTENVLDQTCRINVDELVWRINARHDQLPQIITRRVTSEDFADVR